MKRRDFVIGGAVASTLPARGQQSAIPVVGYLGPESPERFASRVRAFRDGLAETGFHEGQNVEIDFRWAEGRYDRLPALATDLVGRKVTAIAAPGGAPVALAAIFSPCRVAATMAPSAPDCLSAGASMVTGRASNW